MYIVEVLESGHVQAAGAAWDWKEAVKEAQEQANQLQRWTCIRRAEDNLQCLVCKPIKVRAR